MEIVDLKEDRIEVSIRLFENHLKGRRFFAVSDTGTGEYKFHVLQMTEKDIVYAIELFKKHILDSGLCEGSDD